MFCFRDITKQVVLSILLSSVAIIAAFALSVEEELYTGENYAIFFTVALNALWLIPYLFYYISKNRLQNLKLALLLYLLFTMPWIIYRFYKPSFNSQQWKVAVNPNYTYAGIPAHRNGAMLQDLIESNRLVGLSRQQVIRLLGTDYFCDIRFAQGDTVFQYFYTDGKLFDGCDKLCVTFDGNHCRSATFCGCD